MLSRIFKYDFYIILIIFLCLFHLIGNIVWLNLNKVPFPWDQAGHTIIAFKFSDFLSGLERNQALLSISDYYPPFVHLIVAFFILIFGKHILIGPLVITGFFLLSIIFLYLYTYQLFKDKLISFFAASLFSFLPNMYALSREFLLDIPVLAMVLGSLYFLEKSNNFSNRRYSIIFSLFCALALSIKWTALIYLFIPVLVHLVRMLPEIKWKNLLLGIGIILLINLPWYINNLPIILNASKFTATPEAADPQSILSFESFKFYPFMMANFQLTWFGMIVFLVSVIYLLIKRKTYLLFSFLFVYIVFTLIGNKDLRYVIILAPIAAILIAYFLSSFKRKFGILVLTIALFSYYLLYYFNLSFGWPINSTKVDFRRAVQIPSFGWIDLINLGKVTHTFLAPIYNQTVWPNSIIVQELSKHNPTRNIKILMICEKPYFNQVNMELTRRQLNFNKILFLAPYELVPFSDKETMEKYLLAFDVILVADKDLGPEGSIRHIAALKQISNFLKEGKSKKFIKINNYYLPDSDELDVFKPKEDPR